MKRQRQQNKQSSPSASAYAYFSDQATPAGLPWGTCGGGGPEVFRGRSDTMEAIRRELKKEMIREKIILEEIARVRALEAEEVARKLPAERDMQNCGALSPSVRAPPLPPDYRRMMLPEPVGLEEIIITELDEKYNGAGHRRKIRG